MIIRSRTVHSRASAPPRHVFLVPSIAATSDARTETPDISAVFREYLPFVYRALLRLGVSDGDADDVCQEVFMVVLKKLDTFEARSHLRTWIYGIVIRTASDYRKRAPRRREILTDRPPEPIASDDPFERVAERQARTVLDRALETLDDGKRDVFVLYEIEELSMKEVAEAAGCPLQTAYSRLHAARAQVEAFFRAARGEGGSA